MPSVVEMANRYPFQQPQMQPRMDLHVGSSVPAMFPRSRVGMWPSHTSGLQLPDEQIEKQREYLKQQQKLRLLTASTPQAVSADALIENLLGKKETFKPKTSTQSAVPASQNVQMGLGLPAWLTPSSPLLPPLYRQVWRLVGVEDGGLVDTARVFPLLLTSGLPTDVLGFIWGLANRKIAGQLTEQELYIVLALVALAQNGCTFSNLSVLNLIPQPPIPNLKIGNFESMASIPSRESGTTLSPPVPGKMKREDLNLHLVSSSASSFSTPSSVCDDVGLDDFTDFQSARTAPMSVTETSTIREQSDMLTVQKCPNVMVVGSGHGRGVGSRLANHSLGTPKQKKTKHHHHHHHHHRNQTQTITNLTSGADEDFSDFQQAKTSTGDGAVDDIFPKCLAKAPSQGKTYLLKESAIRTEQTIEAGKDAIGFLSIEESPSVVEKPQVEESKPDPKPTLQGPQVFPGLENAPSLPASKQERAEGVNLISIEEDRYSALRNLSLVGKDTSPALVQAEESPVSDDFGDFLSAEPVQGVDDSFADIAAREQTQSRDLVDIDAGDAWKTAEFRVDDWGDYKAASVSNSGQTESKSDISASFMNLNLDGDTWSTKKIDVDFTNLGKEPASVFPASEESSGLGFGNTWDLKTVSDSQKETNTSGFGEMEPGGSSFQGFLGKMYDDTKPDDYASKIDVFCSSPDDQLHGDRSEGFSIDAQVRGGDDDFGEFVGPDTWPEEQKYSVASKDILFDGHLYGDSQSVSSLELPPLALSRHGSVPSLDLKIFPSTAERNGGDGGNQPWDLSPQGIDHQLSEWQRCLQSCLTLLQSAVETFGNISCGEVLDEVVGSAEGKDYLQNLLEVAGVSHRVECSFKQLGSSGDYKQLDSLLADIDCAWSSLESYYTKAEIPIDLNAEVPASSTACCGVCLVDVGSGGGSSKVNSNRNTSQLEYGGHVYHSVCANLWVNCVDSSLPALAVASSGFL